MNQKCVINDINFRLANACYNGDKETALSLIREGADNFDWALQGSCRGGHKELAELMIKYSARLNWGLTGACEGGQKDLALLIIERYKQVTDINNNGISAFYDRAISYLDFNYCLVRACLYGYKELVLLMIKNGAIDYNWGLAGACENGHLEIIELLIDKGADIYKCDVKLKFEDYYYLYQKGLYMSKDCEKYKQEYLQTLNEIFNIDDLVKFMISF